MIHQSVNSNVSLTGPNQQTTMVRPSLLQLTMGALERHCLSSMSNMNWDFLTFLEVFHSYKESTTPRYWSTCVPPKPATNWHMTLGFHSFLSFLTAERLFCLTGDIRFLPPRAGFLLPACYLLHLILCHCAPVCVFHVYTLRHDNISIPYFLLSYENLFHTASSLFLLWMTHSLFDVLIVSLSDNSLFFIQVFLFYSPWAACASCVAVVV